MSIWLGVYMMNENNFSAKQYIILAFMDLLKIKKPDRISVKEIVTKAGISRSTFYLHFQDKHELMEFVREKITTRFLTFYEINQNDKVLGVLSIQTITLNICKHINEYRSFYQHELENPEYTQKLSHALAERLTEVYGDKSYAIFAGFGTIGYLSFWVKGNFQINPQQAAEELMKIGITDWSKYNSQSYY
jgi:AcrR family transcriptional regulator